MIVTTKQSWDHPILRNAIFDDVYVGYLFYPIFYIHLYVCVCDVWIYNSEIKYEIK